MDFSLTCSAVSSKMRSMENIHYAQWFPLDRWLVALAMGWRVPDGELGPIPMLGYHGTFAILLVRENLDD